MTVELPLPTRDPLTGGRVVVTRVEGVESGITIEGRFSLGWIGRLTPQQLEFVGLLLRHRTNAQQLATELGVAYNTVRKRIDDVVAALEADEPAPVRPHRPTDRADILRRLAAGDLDVDEARALLEA